MRYNSRRFFNLLKDIKQNLTVFINERLITMNIIKSLNGPVTLLLISILGITGCTNDITARSRSYSNFDVNMPMVTTDDKQSIQGGVFQLVSANPESTLALNIDTNSYGNLRRIISNNEIPSTVRLAEWVNYFNYDYAKPDGKAPFKVTTEIAPAPWNKSSKLMLIGVKASSPQSEQAPANNIVVLIDISSGMDNSAVVGLIKNTLKELAEELRPQDKIAFVNYSSTPSVALDSTSGEEKSDIKKGISNIEFGAENSPSGAIGSVNLAYTVLENNLIKKGNNFVLFITDGSLDTNSNGMKSIERTLARKNAAGFTFSSLVFNTGKYNYQAMQKLADLGGGVHAYVDTLNEAGRVIKQQLASDSKIIAQPVGLKVKFNPDYVYSYRLLGYEKNNVKTITQDKSYANAMREGQTFTALYEIETTDYNIPTQPHKYNELGRVSLHYKTPSHSFGNVLELSLIPGQVKNSAAKASKDFAFAAAVATFALHLKHDNRVQDYSIDENIALANSAIGKDELGLRAEFVRLLESYKLLTAAKNN